MNRYSRSLLKVVQVIAISAVGVTQSYALNDDEAAVLMGLAVGGITAYTVQHHREHDRHDWNANTDYQSQWRSDPYSGRDRDHRAGHHFATHPGYHSPSVVIINNRMYRGHRTGYRHGYWQGNGHRHGPHCGSLRW